MKNKVSRLITYFLSLSFLLMVSMWTHAQTPEWIWAKQANGQNTTTRNVVGNKIVTDNVGNSYVTGWYQAPSATFDTVVLSTASFIANLFVAKYDPNGQVLWVVQSTGCYYSYGLGIDLDSYGHVYVTGNYGNFSGTCSFGPYTFQSSPGIAPMYIAQLNTNDGSVNWVKEGNVIGQGNSVATFGSNSIYVTGSSDNDFFLTKYDSAGNVLWNRVVATSTRQAAGMAVTTDSKGNIVVTGNYNGTMVIGSSSLTGGSIFVAKYDTTGNVTWAKSCSGTNYYYNGSTSIDTDTDDNILIAGFYINTLGFDSYSVTNTSGNYMNFVARLNTAGNTLWLVDAGVVYNNVGVSPALVATTNLNLILVGTYSTANANNASVQDIYVMKFDAAGNKLWHLRAGGSAYDLASCVSKDGFGNYYLTGFSQSARDTFGTIVLQNAGGWREFFIAILRETSASIQANFNASDLIICEGATIAFTDQSSNNPANWNWTFTGGTPYNSNVPNPSVTYNTAGTYDVKLVVTNSSGSDSLIKTDYITVNPLPNAGTISANPDTVCLGNNTQLHATGTSGSIQWQNSSDGISFADNIGDTLSIYNASGIAQTTYYRVKVSNECGIDSSTSFKLNVHPLPVAELTTADSLICSGDSALICASGGSSYAWNTGETTNCIQAGNAGGYWATVTDANGCSAVSEHLNIAVHPTPPVSIIVQGDTLSSFNAVSYQWYLNETHIPGATSAVYIAAISGNYSVMITDNNGCVATSTGVPVIVSGIDKQTLNADPFPFPNPFSNFIHIAADDLTQIEVYEISGRLVSLEYSDSPKNEMKADLSILEAGIYYLKINAGSKSYLRRIVKQ